jgi:hypothetical protein
MSDDTILDTLCYLADGEDDNPNSSVDYTDISIDIVDVVYDPPGSDTNHEELHLLSS